MPIWLIVMDGGDRLGERVGGRDVLVGDTDDPMVIAACDVVGVGSTGTDDP
jgi:hypothetical protein